jgi:molybdopterin/thiamine biosynthesis adenylyltransferase
MRPPYVYNQSAFEAFCADLVVAGFSPVLDTRQATWIGPLPETLRSLTDVSEMRVSFPDGWPALAVRGYVPGLVSDHVAPDTGYICLWADDDPAQVAAQTWDAYLQRLRAWAESAARDFRPEDRALDAWLMFPGRAALAAELDISALFDAPRNGETHVVHGRADGVLTLSRRPAENYPLSGPVFFRDAALETPRSFEDFRAALTSRQRRNLENGLGRRRDARENNPSGGYDFAVLAWPKYDQHEALVLSFAGAGGALTALANATSPSDTESRLRRAGPDARGLRDKRVLIAGVGAVGSQVARTLAASGVGRLRLHDNDSMRSTNLVRHILLSHSVGYTKAGFVKLYIEDIAPWCKPTVHGDVPMRPDDILPLLDDVDLVVDCTGVFAATLAIAVACGEARVPLISAALARGGGAFRIQRQTDVDVPLMQRTASEFPPIPPGDEIESFGFLELGCTAPVHNAPPASALRAASETTLACIDLLLGRDGRAADTVTILRSLDEEPFDVVGEYRFPVVAP